MKLSTGNGRKGIKTSLYNKRNIAKAGKLLAHTEAKPIQKPKSKATTIGNKYCVNAAVTREKHRSEQKLLEAIPEVNDFDLLGKLIATKCRRSASHEKCLVEAFPSTTCGGSICSTSLLKAARAERENMKHMNGIEVKHYLYSLMRDIMPSRSHTAFDYTLPGGSKLYCRECWCSMTGFSKREFHEARGFLKQNFYANPPIATGLFNCEEVPAMTFVESLEFLDEHLGTFASELLDSILFPICFSCAYFRRGGCSSDHVQRRLQGVSIRYLVQEVLLHARRL